MSLLKAAQIVAVAALISTCVLVGLRTEQTAARAERIRVQNVVTATRANYTREDYAKFQQQQQDTPSRLEVLASEVVHESVFLEAPDCAGSGALFSRTDKGVTTSFVWTCAHVVTAESQVVQSGFLSAEMNGEKIPARVVASGNFNNIDVALLVLDRPFKSAGSIKFVNIIPPVGSAICYAGSALAVHDPPSFFAGIISADTRVEEGEVTDQLEMPGYPGCSGAGYFNLKGECIGLMEARKSDGLGFGIPSRNIIRWAKEQGYLWALDPSVPLPEIIPTYRIGPRTISVENSTQGHDYGKKH